MFYYFDFWYIAMDNEILSCVSLFWGYIGVMDLRGRVPNIRALQRQLGLGSYDKLHRALSGKGSISVPLAKRIEKATGGAIKWTEFFDHSVPMKAA